MSSNTLADCSGSRCVCAIDLGHLIRKPSDRLLTSNSGSINPFQNIPLLFALLCSISPVQACRGRMALNYSHLPHNSFLFFLECELSLILWNTIKTPDELLRNAWLSVRGAGNHICYKLRSFSLTALYSGSRLDVESSIALQRFGGSLR